MAALPYMPLYVADYLADAAHLTAAGHGAYLLLIMTYWQRGEPFPDDERKIARIARMTEDQWSDVAEDVRDFFDIQDGLWRHKRIDSELQKVQEKSEKARLAGRRSVKSRQQTFNERSTDVQRTLNERSTDAERTFNHTDTDTDTYKKHNPNGLCKKNPDDQVFAEPVPGKAANGAGSPKPDHPAKPRKSIRKPDPVREALASVLSSESAQALMDHRKALKKPLTARAAELLAAKLVRCRDGPEAAANAMIEFGWQGFEPDWYDDRKRRSEQARLGGGGSSPDRSAGILEAAARAIDHLEGRSRPVERPEPVHGDGEPGGDSQSAWRGQTLDGTSERQGLGRGADAETAGLPLDADQPR